MDTQAFIFKAKGKKSYKGLCFAICGQAYVLGASLRGFYWRFGGKICTPKPGYSESLFALRTKLLIAVGLKDELVPVEIYPLSIDRNRNNRIRGIIHASKHGLLTMSFSQMALDSFPQMDSKILEGFTVAEAEDVDSSFYDYKGRNELDSD